MLNLTQRALAAEPANPSLKPQPMNQNEQQPEQMPIIVEVKDSMPYIDDRMCSYETIAIRSEIQDLAKDNAVFYLPSKYTYVVTEINGFAKIVPDKNTPTMANDNQTALMQSIQRKKDRIEFLKPLIKGQHSKRSIRSWEIETEILKDEITEDEKLLEVDRQNHIDAHMAGMDSMATGRPELYSEIWFNDKYGTDGK